MLFIHKLKSIYLVLRRQMVVLKVLDTKSHLSFKVMTKERI